MAQNKSHQVWMPILLSTFMVSGMLLGYNMRRVQVIAQPVEEGGTVTSPSATYGAGRVEEVLRYVDSRYVDDVDRDKIIQDAIDHLLDELDPHSNYIPASELARVNEHLEGNFVGVGIEFDIYQDTILVLAVTPGGPSAKVGVLPGDRIVTVDDSLLAGVDLQTEDVIGQLRGEEGSEARLGIKRNGETELLNITVARGQIPIHSVDAALMLDAKTGYIKINRFSETTYDEFMSSMDKLHEQGLEDLVIDLRQNPGGYLKEATRILNQLIEKRDEMLVYTEGEHSTKKEYKTKGAVKYRLDDIAVLIDEGSASASEILAGALQDSDRGLIVGRRSFGKGLVQEQYNLSGGAALRLTIARYYMKSGRLIQKSYEDGEAAYINDAKKRLENGEYDSAGKTPLSDSTKYYTNSGRVVYSGAGIIPDVFVPMDSLYRSEDYIIASNGIREFVYGMLDKERSRFLDMGMEEFVYRYEVSDALFDRFTVFALDKDLDLETVDLQALAPHLKMDIKETIARQVYGLEGYYSILKQHDPMLMETMEVLDESKALLIN